MSRYVVVETLEDYRVEVEIGGPFRRLICRCESRSYAEFIAQFLEDCPVAGPWDYEQ